MPRNINDLATLKFTRATRSGGGGRLIQGRFQPSFSPAADLLSGGARCPA